MRENSIAFVQGLRVFRVSIDTLKWYYINKTIILSDNDLGKHLSIMQEGMIYFYKYLSQTERIGLIPIYKSIVDLDHDKRYNLKGLAEVTRDADQIDLFESLRVIKETSNNKGAKD
jgi:hypothetical protein